MCITAIATALTAASLGMQAVGAVGQFSATRAAASASRRAEALRAEQMRAESMRRQRESIRQSLIANSMARARNVSQTGGLYNSVYQGALGQTQGELGRQLSYTAENERIGAGIFAANMDLATAQGNAANWSGFGQLGDRLGQNAVGIGKLGTTLFGSSTYQGGNGGWTTTYRPAGPGAFDGMPAPGGGFF